MGRPRQHDEQTAAALLAVAERIVAESGLPALSVRLLSREAGTSTRAVYSLFGAKEGLIIALGTRAFILLRDALEALPMTDDPAADLVEAGVTVFRRFTLEHPALFTIGFLQTGVSQTDVPAAISHACETARVESLARLHARIERLQAAGRLGRRSVPEAALAFHALCEGLTALEARRLLPAAAAEAVWRDAFAALVAGWDVTG